MSNKKDVLNKFLILFVEYVLHSLVCTIAQLLNFQFYAAITGNELILFKPATSLV